MVLVEKERRDANPSIEQRSFVPETNELADTSLHVGASGEGGGEAWCFSASLTTCLKIKEFRGTFWNVLEGLERTRPTALQKRVVLSSLDNLHSCDPRFLRFSVIHTRAFYYKPAS